jgi:quinoprotein glucose dehydrogenase
MRRIAAGFLLLLTLSTHAAAQTTIRAGLLLDGRGNSVRNARITIVDGRITTIDQQPGSVTHDLSRYTVMPGGIDTHVHINWHFDPDGKTHHLNAQQETPQQAMQYAIENALVTLHAGITTVQSLGAAIDGPLRDTIAKGHVPGPRIITSLRSISSGTPERIRETVQRLKADGADVIKVFASASIRDGGAATMSLEQLQAACGEARAQGLRAVVHAHGSDSAIRAAQAGCTTIEHGALLDDAALDTLAARRMFYDPNIGLVLQNYLDNRAKFEGIGNYNAEGFAHMERAVPLALDAFRRALRRPGIRIVFGTDAVAGAHGRNWEEIIYRVQQGGQQPMDAIVSATSRAAESLNLADRIGALAPGMQADIIALDGDPLTDITALRRVVFVMQNGTVYRTPATQNTNSRVEWNTYAADGAATKFSPLADITRTNVAQLQPAWEWRTGERAVADTDSTKAARPGDFQVTPLMIGDTLFLSTPFNRVVALDGNTGAELWRYDPGAHRFGQPSNGTGFVHRGVASWSDGTQRRIFLNSRWRLIALDAKAGTTIGTFGNNGEVDLTASLRRPVNKLHYTNTSPPVVWRDLIIVGNGVGDRLTYPNDPPGDVQAYDARTGKLVWRFNTVPDSGELGWNTWENGSYRTAGHTNVWAPFSVDTARGLVYLPVSTPSNDWYGGARRGDNLFGESLVVLDARNGRRVWHFQTVHHGLWDYDPPAAPVLFTVQRNGRTVDGVALLGKTGFAYVFDRVSGEPFWPIEERAVPASDVPGERAAATQPFPTKPLPFTRQGFTENDVIDFTPELKQLALAELKRWRHGPLFLPPSLQGSIAMPGVIGGAGWGGGAFDPTSGVLYVKGTNQPALFRLLQPPASDTINATYAFDRGASLSVRVPDRDGARMPSLPLNKPPYGNLTAINLATGDHVWQVTLGDNESVRNHPLLRDLKLQPLGVAGAPGPIVTAGGLLFVTGGGDVLYALDTRDGSTVWQTDLGARAYAVPMTYRTSAGRQFVVIATGSGNDAVLKAFALPK